VSRRRRRGRQGPAAGSILAVALVVLGVAVPRVIAPLLLIAAAATAAGYLAGHWGRPRGQDARTVPARPPAPVWMPMSRYGAPAPAAAPLGPPAADPRS
jgi:hypothetical protein